jgi:phosphohistidine phosphatase
MRRLTILRHAKSSWDDPKLADFDRPLNQRGWKASRRMGRELKRRKMHFDLCVASTAARVRETLDGLVEGYGEPGFEIRFEAKIYDATVATLLELVHELPDSARAPLLVGHNPGLENLILRLSGDDSNGLRSRIAEGYPTAALAVIELHAGRWKEVDSGSGEIVELILPRELD